MAAVEDDKNAKGWEEDIRTAQKRTATQFGLDDFMNRYLRAVLEQRKDLRDKIDGPASRFSSLTNHERSELALNSFVLAYAAQSDPLEAAQPYPKLSQSTLAFSNAQFRDHSSIPPKQYEALLKLLWKTAKEDIDNSLTSPEAKKLLAPKSAPKK